MAQSGSSRSDAHHLFRRCVQCPPAPPSCPQCAADETCSLSAQSCNSCASTTCVKLSTIPGQSSPKKSTPVGGIVGGVIGGLIFLAIVVYCIYRFRVRKKKRVETWDPPEKRDQSTLHRAHRQSTRSAHSIASTVLTRASNVIQIAYIPGVTVRSPPESPALLVPPVPALPGGVGSSTTSTPALEQHFFMPGDLRDSTWSDTDSVDARFSVAPSLARNSVATTIYRSDAIVPPIPAQQAFRAQANVVSVKSGANTPGTSSTPSTRTPKIPQGPAMGSSGSSIVARNVMARPIEVKKTSSGTSVPTLANLAKRTARQSGAPTPSSAKSIPIYSDEKEVVVSKSTVTSPSTALMDDPISPVTIPRPAFAGNQSTRSSSVSAILPADALKQSPSNNPINAMIADAINRARDPQAIGVTSPTSRPPLIQHDSGPFSDANEVKENSS
ncbi:overproduction-induced pheromone-resistant [Rhinocladiella similis]